MIKKIHVKTGDTVMIVSGDDKGSIGKVLTVSPKEGKVIVEGCNKVKKHVKARKATDQGGIVEAEAAMYASKVMLYCRNCKKASRAAYQVHEDGSKERVCARCKEKL